MGTLENIIMDIARPANPIRFDEGAAFFVGMKKMAEELGAQPDTSGQVEGPFAVPLDQAVQLMAHMVANEFKTQVYYVYYANMLRGLSHHAIAEEFLHHAQHELEHAQYLLRRIGVLSPGGVPIPSYPPPEPLSDANEIVQTMIVVEQMGLSLWKQLLAVMGDNPMKHTIEDFLRREEEHQDELWQLVEQPGPTALVPEQAQGQSQQPQEPKPEPAKTQVKVETTAPQETAEPKLAAAMRIVQQRKLAADRDRMLAELAIAVKNNNKSEISRLKGALGPVDTKTAALAFVRAKRANFVLPPPAQETAESYMQREQELDSHAAVAEAAHAKTIAMQATQAAQQAQAEAQAAQQQAQELQANLEQQTAAAQQASAQAMQSQQQAAEAEARAAEHSISKMQLGMRMNQLRQELANLVMQDPVSESAATVSDLAAQGQPATPMQQAQAEQAAMMGEQPQSAESQQQSQEAQNAQQHADEQAAEAEQSAQKDQAKAEGGGASGGGGKGDGTSVTVKTSQTMATIAPRSRGGKPLAQVMASAPPAAGLTSVPGAAGGVLSKLRGVAQHPAAMPAALGGLGIGALGVGAALAHHAKSQSKVASPADRRMREMIMQGGDDTLGTALRSLVSAPKQVVTAAAPAGSSEAADALVNQGVAAAKQQFSTLGARIRPHLPGFAAGAGAALVGSKMMSNPQQPTQEWE
jgi:bacterioferritin (cytochrome b1)